MNFLAHIHLSGSSEQVIIGNFIGDSIKGRHFESYPEMVQHGIWLHRHIDFFTDTHRVVRDSKKLLTTQYGRYSGVVVDILYDYFLSVNWELFSGVPLDEFILDTYELLIRNSLHFPKEVKRFFPFFILRDWLGRYTSLGGIHEVLYKMSVKTSLPDRADDAMDVLEKHYDEFNSHFLEFFPELVSSVRKEYKILLPDMPGIGQLEVAG